MRGGGVRLAVLKASSSSSPQGLLVGPVDPTHLLDELVGLECTPKL